MAWMSDPFVKASIKFTYAVWTGEDTTDVELALMEMFFEGEHDRVMYKAWAAYRKRLLYHHRRES